MILDKKNEIKVAHFPKKHRFSPILFCKDNNKITKKKEIRSENGKKTDERVISGHKKKPLHLPIQGLHQKRRLPTLPLLRSTIGVTELNFSVRNGKRWNLSAIVT